MSVRWGKYRAVYSGRTRHTLAILLLNDRHTHYVIIPLLLPFIQCALYLRLWYSDLHIPTFLIQYFLRNWQFWIFLLPTTPFWPVYPLCFFFLLTLLLLPWIPTPHTKLMACYLLSEAFPHLASVCERSLELPPDIKSSGVMLLKLSGDSWWILEFVTITAVKQFQNVISRRPLLRQEELALIN